jgi:hypothetical protein
LTARTWRRFHARSATKPTARMAEVKNHIAIEGKINADLDNGES